VSVPAYRISPNTSGPHGRAQLARTWSRVVWGTAYVPMSVLELDAFLLELVDCLADAVVIQPFSPEPGRVVGTRMVAAQLVGIDTLRRTVDTLVEGLLELSTPGSDREIVALLAALSTGYADALRRRTLEQQEDMKRALLSAKQRAERVLRATEHRFREIFTSSPVGIAITSLDGRFHETNPALARILGCPSDGLTGRSLVEFFTDDEPINPRDPLRGRRKLMNAAGETAWVYIAMSPLQDGPDEPDSYVTTVQDLSELQLLQGRFGHQLLHDALTGLANRLRFESALETRLGQAAPDAPITLYRLNLDAFSVINNGLGHEVGDRVLKTVATRLESVLAAERALVARTGGDEFAILVEESAGTPDIPRMVALINEALAEPEYVDGRGIAVGATIGAVRGTASAMRGTELFRAADAALHGARAAGRRQWMAFDQQRDEQIKRAFQDAAALPGAFENGELEVAYQPVVRLADRHTVAYRGMIEWIGRAAGPLGEDDTMALAESTGSSVLLGPWLLEVACHNLSVWNPTVDAVLRIRLSRLQSAADDLVAAVVKATEAGGIAPHLLEIGFDSGAVFEEYGAAQENLEVVAEIGVRTALCGFDGGPRELALLSRSSASSVVLRDPFGGKDEHDEVVERATGSLIDSLHDLGVTVSVDNVRTDEEADWWAGIGADTAQGPLFGMPTNLERILSPNGRAG
jgi:diguanylate cyclase (GGDEF)-like protein/PAS domain S-box-containing protein